MEDELARQRNPNSACVRTEQEAKANKEIINRLEFYITNNKIK